jgi:hypothetical protein
MVKRKENFMRRSPEIFRKKEGGFAALFVGGKWKKGNE